MNVAYGFRSLLGGSSPIGRRTNRPRSRSRRTARKTGLARRSGTKPAITDGSARQAKRPAVVDPAAAAHRLRVAENDWNAIATSVGYISGQVAQMAVTAMLRKAAVEQAADIRRAALWTELERLDALHAAFWPLAMQGDHAAASVILKISDRRASMLGLSLEGVGDGWPTTIVITGGPAMADELRDLALRGMSDQERRAGYSAFTPES